MEYMQVKTHNVIHALTVVTVCMRIVAIRIWYSRALQQHRGESAVDILGDIDAVKVRSCMTLFDAVSPDDIFQEVLDAFYEGKSDKKTLDLM